MAVAHQVAQVAQAVRGKEAKKTYRRGFRDTWNCLFEPLESRTFFSATVLPVVTIASAFNTSMAAVNQMPNIPVPQNIYGKMDPMTWTLIQIIEANPSKSEAELNADYPLLDFSSVRRDDGGRYLVEIRSNDVTSPTLLSNLGQLGATAVGSILVPGFQSMTFWAPARSLIQIAALSEVNTLQLPTPSISNGGIPENSDPSQVGGDFTLSPQEQKISGYTIPADIVGKVDQQTWALVQIMRENPEQSPLELSQTYWGTSIVNLDETKRVLIKIRTDDAKSPELISHLLQAGATITSMETIPGFESISAWITKESLEDIGALPEVKTVELPSPSFTNAGTVMTFGDSVPRTQLARAGFAADGTGDKIGVISDGADHWTSINGTPAAGFYGAKTPDASNIYELVSGLKPSTAYTFSVYCKVSAGCASLSILDVGGSTIVSSPPITSTSYVQVTVNSRTGSTADSANILLSSASGSSQFAYFDDVLLSFV